MAALLEDADVGAALVRDIAWDNFASARLISEKDLQLIRRYDKRSAELRASMLEEVSIRCSSN
jgi:V-type H+-transporting ATPase subunit H